MESVVVPPSLIMARQEQKSHAMRTDPPVELVPVRSWEVLDFPPGQFVRSSAAESRRFPLAPDAPPTTEFIDVEPLTEFMPRGSRIRENDYRSSPDRRSDESLRRALAIDDSIPDARTYESVQYNQPGREQSVPQPRFLGRADAFDRQQPLHGDRAPPGFDEWLASSNAQAMRQVATADMNSDLAPLRTVEQEQRNVARVDGAPRVGPPFASAMAGQPTLPPMALQPALQAAQQAALPAAAPWPSGMVVPSVDAGALPPGFWPPALPLASAPSAWAR